MHRLIHLLTAVYSEGFFLGRPPFLPFSALAFFLASEGTARMSFPTLMGFPQWGQFTVGFFEPRRTILQHFMLAIKPDSRDITSMNQIELENSETHEDRINALEAALKEVVAWRTGKNTKAGLKNMNAAKDGACFANLDIAKRALEDARHRRRLTTSEYRALRVMSLM